MSGVIGCGNIAAAYLKAARHFPVLDIRAVADLRADAAEARGREFGIAATSIEALLADPGIGLVINLTIPRAHVDVGLRVLAAGKHVYGEKPLGITLAEGRTLMTAGEKAGLRVGSAPDTFLGGAHQSARAVLDSGALGAPVGGTAFFMCPGHESWHPDPAFYYDLGGGPMLDMGPYYITALVNLLGPVARVGGMTATPRQSRTVTSQPRHGEQIAVVVPTHVTGTVQFHSGALVQIAMSFDVAGHRHLPLEIYGTEASLLVPDPNGFGGVVSLKPVGGDWRDLPVDQPYADGNYRSLGAADMALAILEGRPHRASGELALHVLEVMEGFEVSSRQGRVVDISTTPERPAPLTSSLADGRIG